MILFFRFDAYLTMFWVPAFMPLLNLEILFSQKALYSRVKPCCRHRFDGEMIAQMNLFRVPMIDHRQQFGGEMIALLTGTFFR